jgi:hypothetical protein
VDKRLKIDKPLGTIYLSHTPYLIKVANTASSETTRANEIAVKTTKTSKVTAVVVIMSIFSEKDASCGALIAEMRSFLPKRRKVPFFQREIPTYQETLLRNQEKAGYPLKVVPKLKKLELNCTNLELNSKKTHSDCAKTPDPIVSSGQKVKNKVISVLLDSGSSGDFLFMKKGSSKCISVVKRVVPQSWGTSNGTFAADRVSNIEISFVEYPASKKVLL